MPVSSKKSYTEIELDELHPFGGKSVRQFILNENSPITTTGNLKKSTFLVIFMSIIKEFIEKTKKMTFPFATSLTLVEVGIAWFGFKEKNNQNTAAKRELGMTILMAAKETTAVLIALIFTGVSAAVAPIMFLVLIGRNMLNAGVGIYNNLVNLWKHRKQSYSYYYAAEKAALKDNLDNFITSAILLVGIFVSFLAPQFPLLLGIFAGAAYTINMTTVSVLAASVFRSIGNSIQNMLGFNKPADKSEFKEQYLNENNFASLKDSHIDDLLLKLKFLYADKPAAAEKFLRTLINESKISMWKNNIGANEEQTKANNNKIDALKKLETILTNKKVPEDLDTIPKLVKYYNNKKNFKEIMTSDHNNVSDTQKLFVLMDQLIQLRDDSSVNNVIESIIFTDLNKETRPTAAKRQNLENTSGLQANSALARKRADSLFLGVSVTPEVVYKLKN